MSSPRFISFRSLQLSALLLLSGVTVLGQGFTAKIPDTSESPLERAKRAREELALRLQDEANGVGLETLEEKVARLKRELAAAEAELAARDAIEPMPTASEIESGALVVISSDQSEGSGFIAEMRGRTFLITNIHVLGAARGALIRTLDGEVITLPSYGFISQKRDIALVPIEWEGPTLPLSQSLSFDEVGIGQAVTVVGNSDGAGVGSRLTGEVTGVGPDELQVSAKFVPGNSGSPIMHDELGKVVAIASRLKDFSVKSKWTEDSEQADIRRFGYRLDGEIEWGQIALNDLYQQSELYHRYEDRTKVMWHISYMLQYEDKLMTGYGSHDSLGYLFKNFDRDFQWQRGTNSSHNQRMLKRFVTSLLMELQSDRQSTADALQVDFYRRRYYSIDDVRDEAIRALTRFQDSRLAL
ncbi:MULTISPECIES: serine protease [unclassified Lentimonas]|uniref:S1 family peptidase n=1 Tax=unclassified Lentimonas TaxID=2630993 RepID=UPI001323CDBA|nr:MULTISPECIES: serine protease [unclassified Lentimonas]CAA7183389.1 Unannotated [Lentimonas sp. CC8]CAA6678792.1 Unannotated [Lentimonas sp. CC4]CAA6684396.1 Unannotated [Lentimonas sp. CC6]CAA7077525.1 Unannotated [Lentimonas sp. CC4]CAA7171359.1 Unannotated [Lentimonas sp. CC21]